MSVSAAGVAVQFHGSFVHDDRYCMASNLNQTDHKQTRSLKKLCNETHFSIPRISEFQTKILTDLLTKCSHLPGKCRFSLCVGASISNVHLGS